MNGPEVKLSELYQEVILDHNKKPRHFGKIEGANAVAHGKNPLCGDDYFVYLSVNGQGKIEKVAFEGSGCAISKSSASLMTTFIENKSVNEAKILKDHFIHVLTDAQTSPKDVEAIGRLKIFEGVRQFPVRVKCATLAWRALEAALQQNSNQHEVSTE